MSSLMTRAEMASANGRPSDALSSASQLAQAPSIDLALQAVREFLGMEIAYATEHVGEIQHIRRIDGDDTPPGEDPDYAIPLEDTYCKRILAGELPNLIADVQGNAIAAALPISSAEDIGAFCSVPLRFSDGSLFGTLCAESSRRRDEFGPRDLEFMHVFARMISDQLERQVQADRMHRLELENAAAAAILAAVAARDAYTADHSHAVVDCALAVARELGLDDVATQEVRQVALLHDIGKIAIPDAILRKPGALDQEEIAVMRTHPVESERIVAGLPGLRHLAPAMRAEHERFDGKGYPDGLVGETIPLASRITLVCDAYHAMVSDRPYRAALSLTEARERIREGAGTQFCPRAAHALIASLSR
ncbi:MAG TPA: HD domain-containing phosphohydrolase [Gaiellales bacterium]|jgi:GAF domain-containing protein